MINKQLINLSSPASSGGNAEAEQGLILHLDANDVDSYDGDGAEWVDISTFEKTIPISENEVDLDFYIDPTDPNSYSGSGNIITDIAGAATVTKDSGIDYDTDNGGYFDKTNTEDITTNYSPDNLTEFTAEVWVNPNSVTQNVSSVLTVIDSSNSNALLIMYLRANQRQIQFSTYYGETSFVRWNPTGDTSVQYNKWQHLVMTCKNNGKMVIYLDGEVKQTLDFPHTMNTSVANLEIGHIPSNSTYGFYGKMGAVRFYSKQLSASDIGQNYRHGRDFVYTDLIDDTDLELHLDAASFADGSTNTPSTWTALTGSNGTITNATFDSELGNYLDFDGSGDKVTIGTQSYFHSTNDFTAELWVKKITTNEDLIFKLGSTHPTYYLLYNHSVGFWFLDYTTSPRREIRTGPLTGIENQWTHITLVVDGGNIAPKIYVNGEQKISSVFTPVGSSGGTSGNKDLIIGEGYAAAAWGDWEGKIGQIRWYSSKLTQDQIRQNYNYTKPNYPNGYNGTITGATWNSAGYFDFDGSTNDVKLNTSNFFSNDFTLSMWWKFDSLSGYQMLFGMQGYGSSSYNGIGHYINGSTIHTWVQIGGSGSAIGQSSSILSTGTWHNIVLLREGSTWKHYLDGALVGTYANKTTAAMNSPESKIGEHFSNSGLNTDGKCSKVKLYNKALSPTEITEIYTEGE